jgi:type II secretory pathway component GspD/PulD (secretin)
MSIFTKCMGALPRFCLVCLAVLAFLFASQPLLRSQEEEPEEKTPAEESPPEQPPAEHPPEQSAQPPAKPPAQPPQPTPPAGKLVPDDPPVPPDETALQETAEGAVQIGRMERGDFVTILYRVDSAKIKMIKQFLDPLITKEKGNIVVGDEKTPLISVTDTKQNIKYIETMIQMIDSPSPQVLIEAVVAEQSVGTEREYGAEVEMWEMGSDDQMFRWFDTQFNPSDYMSVVMSGFPDRFQGGTFTLFWRQQRPNRMLSTIRALEKRTDAKVLSKPRIRVLQNRTAKVNSGQEVIFYEGVVVNQTVHVTGKPREVGVRLEVTPSVIGDRYICLQIKPEVSAIIGYQPVGGAGIGLQNPIIAKRSTETELIIRDGEMIEIGGLYRTEKIQSESGFPLLMDIPLIGYLFKREEFQDRETEITFHMQAHIIRPGGVYPTRIVQPEELK